MICSATAFVQPIFYIQLLTVLTLIKTGSPAALAAKEPVWLGWQDSNLRMTEPKPVALPLGHTPIKV